MNGPQRFAARPDGGLDAAMRDAYARDGFLILEDFLPPGDCADLQQRASELIAGYAPPSRRTIFSTADQAHAQERDFLDSAEGIGFFFEAEAGLRPIALSLNKIGHALHDIDPVFARVSRRPRLANLARALGLARPLLLQSMYMFKQPWIGGAVDWHQDATFLRTEPSTVTGLWFALDDARRDNGCLLARPGSHHGPLRRRFVRHGDSCTMESLDDSPCRGEPIALEVARGGLVVLHGLLLHASAANRSAQQRHAYALHLVDGTVPYRDDNWLQRSRLPLRGFA